MCRRGENVDVTMVPVMRKRHGDDATIRWFYMPIDQCIAELVRALNAAGHPTTAACCGHGGAPGIIGLQDGRALVVIDAGDRPLGDIAHDLGSALEGTGPEGPASDESEMETHLCLLNTDMECDRCGHSLDHPVHARRESTGQEGDGDADT